MGRKSNNAKKRAKVAETPRPKKVIMPPVVVSEICTELVPFESGRAKKIKPVEIEVTPTPVEKEFCSTILSKARAGTFVIAVLDLVIIGALFYTRTPLSLPGEIDKVKNCDYNYRKQVRECTITTRTVSSRQENVVGILWMGVAIPMITISVHLISALVEKHCPDFSQRTPWIYVNILGNFVFVATSIIGFVGLTSDFTGFAFLMETLIVTLIFLSLFSIGFVLFSDNGGISDEEQWGQESLCKCKMDEDAEANFY